MLVCVESVFESTFIMSKNIPFFVFVIIACLESGTRLRNFRVCFVLNNLNWIVIEEAIAGSYEASFLRNKFVIVLLFGLFLSTSKGGHPEIESIHGPTHGVDERRFILVNKTVDFIRVGFDLLSLLDHLAVWVLRFNFFLRPLTVVLFVLVHATKVDSFLVLESFHIQTFFDAVTKRLLVV